MNKSLNMQTNRTLQIKLVIAAMILVLSWLLSVGFSPSKIVADQIAFGMPVSKDSTAGGQSTLCVRADYCGDGA